MATLKKFRVQKRFTAWMEVEIKATSFEQAVEIGKKLKFTDFNIENDVSEVEGFGVQESW
jgi:adenylate cyclase class IV